MTDKAAVGIERVAPFAQAPSVSHL